MAKKRRADYWKSQPRKQCDFCKCWIADNKPSIAFHENGKRHKENVAKRLSEISKKSAQDAKHQVQVDKEMKKMEEAALKAYMKDIEENADLTSKLLLEGLEQKRRAAEEEKNQKIEAKKNREAAKQMEMIDKDIKRKRVKEKAETTKWCEARSDEGYSYFWHPDTNQTKWEAPKEGYLSIAEQKILEEPETPRGNPNDFKRKNKPKAGAASKKRKPGEDSTDNSFVKKKHHDHEMKKVVCSKSQAGPSKTPVVMGPAPKPTPYGLWKTIEPRIEEDPVDLQLPNQEQTEIKVPMLVDERPKIKFQEKRITKLTEDDESHQTSASFTGFKKKALFRGNARQRLDTDDS